MLQAAAVLLILAGCAAHGPVLAPHLDGEGADRPVELSDTPFFPQTDYQCGPAALAMVLKASGRDVALSELIDQVYVPERKGSLQIEMIAAARRHGRLPYRLDPEVGALLAELRGGRPVLVFQNLGIRLLPVWHYAVIVGYDPDEDSVVLRSGTKRRKVMGAADFVETWERGGRWAIVALEPGEMPARPDRGRYLSAASAMARVNPPDVSVRLMRAAARQWLDDALVHFALGNALYEQGRSTEALASYRHALSLDPGLLAARNNLAHLLAEQGCHGRALEEIEQALSRHREIDAELERTLIQTRSEIRRLVEEGGGACTGALAE